MRGSPKGARRAADWTLKWRGEAGGSPKGARKSCGMDFEAEGRHAEVQNASRCTRAEDQT